MYIVLSNSSDLPIYEQIKEQVKTQILSGELSENEMLPSLRVVADARQQSYNVLSASPVLPFLTSSISTNIHIYGFNQTGISF